MKKTSKVVQEKIELTNEKETLKMAENEAPDYVVPGDKIENNPLNEYWESLELDVEKGTYTPSVKDTEYQVNSRIGDNFPPVGNSITGETNDIEEYQVAPRIKTQTQNNPNYGTYIPKEDDSDVKILRDLTDYSNVILREGLKLRKKKEYWNLHAHIPLTGTITGKNYKPGDKIKTADANNFYGNNKPTWCNQFAMDLAIKITGNPNLFKGEQHNLNVQGMLNFMRKSNNFEEIIDNQPFEKAWDEINQGALVFFMDERSSWSEHVAVGIKTPASEIRTRDNYKLGKIIQMGAQKVEWEYNYIDYGWTPSYFPDMKVMKWIG